MKSLIGNIILGTLLFASTTVIVVAEQKSQDIPVTGRPVPEMAQFDDRVVDHMEAHNIESAILGIMRDGEIVYLRGFGYLEPDPPDEADDEIVMRENALVRLASVVKPMTAAAVRHLVSDKAGLDLDSNAFDLGQPGGGAINPYEGAHPDLAWDDDENDQRLKDVTIEHLLWHKGGWDRGHAIDLTNRECLTAEDLEITSPPGRQNQLGWSMGRPLQFTPGDPSGQPHENTWKGAWDDQTNYESNDAVHHDDSAWVAVRSSTNSEPSSGSSAWILLADSWLGNWSRDEAYFNGWAIHHHGFAWVAAGDFVESEPFLTNDDWNLIAAAPVDDRYANIGYLAMGLIVESWSGADFLDYVRQYLLPPSRWVPEHELGRTGTFRWNNDNVDEEHQGHEREPWYRGNHNRILVFDDDPPCETSLSPDEAPYGHRDLEARLAHGGVMASAPVLLMLAQHYHVGSGTRSESIGTPREETDITSGLWHGGAQDGVSTFLGQRTDGTNIFIFLNRRTSDATASDLYFNDGDASDQSDKGIQALIEDLNDSDNWPTTTSDGFWVAPFTVSGDEQRAKGAFDAPLNGFGEASARLQDGSKVRLKPGTHDWTGTIEKKMLIDAPLGTVVIGEPE